MGEEDVNVLTNIMKPVVDVLFCSEMYTKYKMLIQLLEVRNDYGSRNSKADSRIAARR